MSANLTLANARLPDGQLVDVAIADGVVASVDPAGSAASDPDPGSDPNPDAGSNPTLDLGGDLLLCAPAEPHAHIDKAFTADEIGNPTGDLTGAIMSWREHYESDQYDRDQDYEATVERASQAVELALANGYTAIRSHANVGEIKRSVVAVEALTAVRERYQDQIDLQVVALLAPSVVGPNGAYGREQLQLALAAGADIVGGAPMLDTDPTEAITVLFDAATEAALPVDLHTDETLDATMLTLPEICRQIHQREFPHPVAASHCVSLAVQPPETQAQIAAEVAATQVAVITLPQTNLFLQAREQAVSPPRGLTALNPLLQAGATVAGGADNLQDPFNLVGRGDAMETASLLVAAGHLLPEVAYDLVSKDARAAMGLPPAGPEPGLQADLLAVDTKTVREAVAGAITRRRTFRHGRLMAEQHTTTTLY